MDASNSSGKCRAAGALSESTDLGRKEDEFFVALKETIELMKCLALGLAMIGGGYVVLSSGLAASVRGIGAMVCVISGLWTCTAAVLIFSRYRFAMNGQITTRERMRRVLLFVSLLGGVLVACVIVVEMGKRNERVETASSVGYVMR